jgi:hypothetical protein
MLRLDHARKIRPRGDLLTNFDLHLLKDTGRPCRHMERRHLRSLQFQQCL